MRSDNPRTSRYRQQMPFGTNNSRPSRMRPSVRFADTNDSLADRTVLIYHDIRLKASDVDTLRWREWVNDQVISFYFQYLESNVYSRHSQDILLVSAQVTQLLKMSEGRHDDARSLLVSLDCQSKQYMFFPLNNNDTELEGGTHWSLMVYSRPENTFYTFDSIDKRNNHAAQKLYEVLLNALECPTAFNIYFPSAQQQNFWDCGIFVICNVENIIEHLINSGGGTRVADVPPLNLECVQGKRNVIRELIEELARLGG